MSLSWSAVKRACKDIFSSHASDAMVFNYIRLRRVVLPGTQLSNLSSQPLRSGVKRDAMGHAQ